VADSEGETTERSPSGDGGDLDETTAEDEPEPTVQSEALRRQQLFVGSGIAVLGGVAVTVSTLQQFPGVPFFAALVGGMLTSGVLFGLVFVGLFKASGD
jgi:hypothetical protein